MASNTNNVNLNITSLWRPNAPIETATVVGENELFATIQDLPPTLKYPGKVVYDKDNDIEYIFDKDNNYIPKPKIYFNTEVPDNSFGNDGDIVFATILGVNYLYYKSENVFKLIPFELTETDPIFSAWDKSTGILITESQIDDLKAYITDIKGESIGDLSDVDLDSIATGNILKYDGSKFRPSEEATQVQSDWDQADVEDTSFIKNKPDIVTSSNLTTALGNYVPYINATGGVNLGDEGLQCGDLETNGNVQFRNLEAATQETGPRLICSDAEGNLTWRPKGDTDVSISNIPEINLDDLDDGSILKWDPNLEQFVCIDNTPPLPTTYKIRKVLTPIHGHIATNNGFLASELVAVESAPYQKTFLTYEELPITVGSYLNTVAVNLVITSGTATINENTIIKGVLTIFLQSATNDLAIISQVLNVNYVLPFTAGTGKILTIPTNGISGSVFANMKTVGASFEFNVIADEPTYLNKLNLLGVEIVAEVNTVDGLFGRLENL